MKGIKNRVAIITGGANGIGAGLVRVFAAAGAKVTSADVNADAGAAVAAEAGAGCTFVKADLRSDSDIGRLVQTTAETFGGIDFLICAACTYADEGRDADRAAWQ